MPTETNVDAKDAFTQLAAEGAVKTEIVMIQHDVENDLFNCTLVARGFDAANNLIRDIELCPSPCKIGGAFNTSA